MAEEKLGTLQYDMLVDQKKLEQQLEDITKKLQEKDKQWKEILSGQGNVVSPKINVADLGNLTKANEAISISTINIKTSIEKLKIELAGSVKAYEALTQAQREDQKVGGVLLQGIQAQKDQLNEYNKILRQSIDARKLAVQQSKEELSAKQALESQRSKAFVKSNLDDEKQITDEIKKQESALRSLESQRSKAFVRGEVDKEKQITREIKEQQAAIRSLEAQRSKAFVASQTKQLREEQAATKALWQEQKLKLAVDQQASGSIEKLRAQYALLKFQLSQVKFSDPNAVANVQKLQTAISGVKSEIQALQPTLGIWGKLTSAIRTYATAYLSVQAVLGLGRAVYNQTKELDSLNFSMKTVIKSSTELAQTQKFLSDVAINYGGDLLTLSERYIKFRAAAVQSNMSASETQKIFESVSKASGTLGLKTDELSGVYLALEQMISKGKVTTEELRRQLGERLPGAFGIMANALGVTIPELDKLLKKGEILSTVALPKFAAALEKAYGIESLKKIDTLAAAQGRMSTEFTGLIKAMGASDTFKNSINAMASFIGFVKDNIGTIALFTKGILVVTAASLAYRLESALLNKILVASNIIKATYVGWTTKQIVAIEGLTGASLRAAEAQNLAAASTNRWSAVTKTFGGWVGVLVNVLIGAIAYFALFRKSTDDTVDSIKTFNENLVEQYSKVNALFSSLDSAKKGSNEYKDALFEINNQYSKYLPNLLTEKSSIDEVSKARNLSLLGLRDELTLKEKRAKLEAEYATQETFSKNLTQEVAAIDPNLTAYQKGLLISMIKDMGEAGVNETEVQGSRINKQLLWFVKQLNLPIDEKQNIFTSLVVKIRNLTDEAIKENRRAEKAVNAIRNTYKVDEPIKPITLDLTELKDAEEEFKKFDALQKLNKERGLKKGDTEFAELAEPNYTERFYSYKNFLITKRKEFLSQSKEDISARESIDLKLAEIDKKNDPLQKKEDTDLAKRLEARQKLAQLEIELQQNVNEAILAAMKDGATKQYAQIGSQYNERLNQIRKQEQEYLKVLNESLGLKITDSSYITKLPADQQAAFDREKVAAKEQANNAIFKLDEDLAKKQQATYDSVAERFMSDIEKQRMSIEKFYSDQIEALKEIYALPTGRLDEMTGNIVFNPRELDQLKAYNAAVADLIAKKNAELDRVNQETAMKLSPLYQKAFGEIEKYGTITLNKLKKDIEAMLESAKQISVQGKTMMQVQMPNFDEQGRKISDFTTMTIEEFIAWKNKLNDITKKTEDSNPFKTLAKSVKSMIAAFKSGNKEDLSNAVKNFSEATAGAIELTKEWKQSLEPLMDDKTSEAIDKIITGLEGGVNVATGLAQFASGDIVGGITSTLKGIGQLATAFQKNRELSAEQVAEYENLIKVIGEVIDKQMELLASLSGTDAVNASKEILNNIEKSVEAARNMGAAYLESRASHEHSYGYQLREDLRPYVAQINALGVAWDGEATSFMNLSAAQLEVIKTQLPEAWAKLDDKTQAYLQTVMDGTTAIEDLKIALDEALTGLNFDQAKSSLDDLLMNADATMADVASNFEGYMKKAIVNLITSSLLSVELKRWYEEFAKSMEDGVLSKVEVDDLRASYQEIYNRGKSLTNAALDAAGIPKTSESASGISKGIQALTEDTGRRLEGLINSIRESGVINIGNTKQLVESSQMIQGYAAQSLSELRMVNTNLSTQIGIFNEWTTSTNGTGGKGIKVYVQ